jgi:hypothetical protein
VPSPLSAAPPAVAARAPRGRAAPSPRAARRWSSPNIARRTTTPPPPWHHGTRVPTTQHRVGVVGRKCTPRSSSSCHGAAADTPVNTSVAWLLLLPPGAHPLAPDHHLLAARSRCALGAHTSQDRNWCTANGSLLIAVDCRSNPLALGAQQHRPRRIRKTHAPAAPAPAAPVHRAGTSTCAACFCRMSGSGA